MVQRAHHHPDPSTTLRVVPSLSRGERSRGVSGDRISGRACRTSRSRRRAKPRSMTTRQGVGLRISNGQLTPAVIARPPWLSLPRSNSK